MGNKWQVTPITFRYRLQSITHKVILVLWVCRRVFNYKSGTTTHYGALITEQSNYICSVVIYAVIVWGHRNKTIKSKLSSGGKAGRQNKSGLHTLCKDSIERERTEEEKRYSCRNT